MANIQDTSDVISTSQAGASVLAIAVAAGPAMPVELTAADTAELTRLQQQAGRVEASEGRAARRRALLTRSQYRFIRQHGAVSLTEYAKGLGFAYEAASLVYHVSAQLVLNKNVSTAPEAEKEALRNEAAQLARAIAAMERLHAEHDQLSDEQFYTWFAERGHLTGLAKAYRAVRQADRTGKDAGSQADAAAAKTPDEQMNEMFANPAALEIGAVASITSGQEGLFVYRQEGDTIRLIPLAASKATIIGLAGYAPCPLATMPADLRFYREMLLSGASFVPDEMSNVPIEDVPEGDLVNASYDMLPAFGIYLVERDRFSIAHARRDDGLIVEVVPAIDLGYSMKGECFIDNRTRRRLGERLHGEANAARFGLKPVDGMAASLTIEGKTKTLTFIDKEEDKAVNLIVKPRRIGTVWTYRAAQAFAPVASAIMSPDAVAAFDRDYMKVLLKNQKDRPVAITVGRKGISFANGKAAPASFDAEAQGSGKVAVMSEDLRRAMVGLLGLPRRSGLTWHLDTNGMLLIEAATDLATYRVFVQTLEPNREQPTRSRALRERVESLPAAEAAPADMAAAA